MKVILTGASGYVGGMILDALRAHGHEVLALSRRSCSTPWLAYQLGDDPASLPWQGVDALIHAAHDFTARGEEENHRRNVQPSVALLRAARESGVTRLLFISSFSAFAGTRSCYGRAKLAVETQCLSLDGAAIRPGLVWGQQSGGVMGSLERIVTRLPLVPCLTGPRGLPQFLVHEDDLARTVLDALQSPPHRSGRLIEAAHPEPMPLRTILTHIAHRHGLRRLFLPIPWQLAMAALKTTEALRLNASFRSDSLVGLVHGTPSLQSEPSSGYIEFRAFN
jgi:nucleoside-diphosphate-sugar epimerase